MRDQRSENEVAPIRLAQAASPSRATVETVTVTSSKLGGADVQSIPIAITALSQEQLTSTQTAGGPDLVRQVPNLTFSKTNFTGYNIEIRGIGTQAISVTTDPAVAVAFNDIPFIRNHFFEQEFYDVSQVEVLRGPQGTLYGRNATAGVVNVSSAKPTDQFEAMASADIGNYKNRRFEGMLNLPFVSDKLDLRLAGEWTKRNGYSTNDITGNPIDGRDLWSGRASLRWKPIETVTADFIWEHFQEDDDRLRSAKQLCDRGNGPTEVLGVSTAVGAQNIAGEQVLNQGCYPVSLYSPDAFGVPNAQMLPYYGGLIGAGFGLSVGSPLGGHPGTYDPYASTTQSRDLRVIESTLDPHYRAKNDTLELNAEWNVTPGLTLHSDTGYNRDFLSSSEDFNRFNTVPGVFAAQGSQEDFPEIIPENNYVCQDGSLSVGTFCGPSTYNPNGGVPQNGLQTGIYCDPQLGCADRLVAEDLSEEHAWQFNQEFRLASNLTGPLNFSFGGNFLHYETEENYYVFINSLSVYMQDNGSVDPARFDTGVACLQSYAYPDLSKPLILNIACTGGYMDPNPIGQLNNQGHNYFLSQNPYVLNSYAGFGEAYYNVAKDLKLTAGLRWTDDQKHFTDIPSELLVGGPGGGYGYPSIGTVDQQWKKWTGRFVATWTPTLDFTDQSMVYASYSHGYKAGGANPPGAELIGGTIGVGNVSSPVHPLTFEPEFIDAYELGTKNTALDGALTFNADGFFYDYKGYQISQIVDRTSVNLNFDATVWGGEVQATWEPLPGLKFGLAGGYENTSLANGSQAIDLMDRTAGNPNWILVKPNVTQASNCVLPAYVVATLLSNGVLAQSYLGSACGVAYNIHQDPITQATYTAMPPTPYATGYVGFDPLAGTPGDPYMGQNKSNGIDYGPAPNNGEGFSKNLSGNELPNAPKFTLSLTGDYSMPVSADWAATLHSDFYWQSQSWSRVFNAVNDRLHGYTNVNLALILTDTSGWQVMGYVKNVFDTTAITGTFLNSDDTALTTNIFLTDPRLFGVRVTKHFDGGSSGSSGLDFLDVSDDRMPQAWIQLGGNFAQLADEWQHYNPSFLAQTPAGLPSLAQLEKKPAASFDWQGKISIQPKDSDWVLNAGVRYGRSGVNKTLHKSQDGPIQTVPVTSFGCLAIYGAAPGCQAMKQSQEVVDGQARSTKEHLILDFTVGKDVGIGSFGKGTISAGARLARFDTKTNSDFKMQPPHFFAGTIGILPSNVTNFFISSSDLFEGIAHENRNFHGVGPEVTWGAEQPVWGDVDGGQLTVDWGVNAAVLFGQRRAQLHQSTSDLHCQSGITIGHPCGVGVGANLPFTTTTKVISRSHSVSVPNLGGYIGASMRYRNSKISFGYRADTFFNAMDGGQDTEKTYNRGFYGPYLNVSLGL